MSKKSLIHLGKREAKRLVKLWQERLKMYEQEFIEKEDQALEAIKLARKRKMR